MELKQLIEENTTFTNSFKSGVHAFQVEHIDATNKSVNAIEKQSTDFKSTLEEFSNQLNMKIFKIVENLNSHNIKQIENQNIISNLHIKNREEFQSLVNNKICFMEKFKEKILADYQSTINFMQTKAADEKSSYLKIQKDLQEMEDKMSNIKNNLKFFESSNNSIVEKSKSCEQTKYDFEMLFTKEIDSTKSEAEAIIGHHKILGDHLKCLSELDANQFIQNKSIIEDQITLLNNINKDNIKRFEDLNTTVKTDSSVLIKDLESFTSICDKKLENMHSNLNMSLEKNVNDIFAYNDRFELSRITTENLFETLSQNISTAISCTEDRIQQTIKDIELFKTKEIKYYSSTGETPAKKSYTFSKNLPATSPYEKLIERFNLQHNRSVSSIPKISFRVCNDNE